MLTRKEITAIILNTLGEELDELPVGRLVRISQAVTDAILEAQARALHNVHTELTTCPDTTD